MEDQSETLKRRALPSLTQLEHSLNAVDRYVADDNKRKTTYNLYQLQNLNGHVKENNSPPKQEEYETYSTRWYILILFSLVTAQQTVVWNTWGPITDTTKAVLGWNDADIALLTNWGPITYVVSGPIFSWVLDVKGLRVSMLVCSVLMMLGVAIRCIPVPVDYMIWVMNIGQILIGLASPILTASPPLVSAVWFPPHQRTTCTCILSNNFGVAISFLMGPLIVKDLKYQNNTSILPNETIYGNVSDGYEEYLTIPQSEKNQRLKEINFLLYLEAGISAILFIITIIYYPAKPPKPPSPSADTQRQYFVKGATKLFTSSQFWLPALCFSISVGVWTVWNTQLDIIFFNEVDQLTIGWIGFYSNIVGAVISIPVAIFVDHFVGKMKLILMLLSGFGAAGVIWILFMVLKIMPFNLASLYVSLIGISVIINSVMAPYFEITVEGTYPVAEGTTAMLMTWLMNVFGLLFLLLMMDEQIGVKWMNYAMLAAIAVCIPMLLLYNERYNRLSQDTDAIPNKETTSILSDMKSKENSEVTKPLLAEHQQ